MKLALAAICDYAMIDKSEKLSVIGIFTRIGAPSVPARHGSLTVVLSFEVDPSDFGRAFDFAIDVVDEDGRPIIDPPTGTFSVPDGGVGRAPINLLLNLQDVHFPRFGPYLFTVRVNGHPEASLELEVVPVA